LPEPVEEVERPVAAYETLRDTALSPSRGHATLGRVYLEHRGLAAWLQSWPTRQPADPPQPLRPALRPVPGPRHGDTLPNLAATTSLLADMLLSNLVETTP